MNFLWSFLLATLLILFALFLGFLYAARKANKSLIRGDMWSAKKIKLIKQKTNANSSFLKDIADQSSEFLENIDE